MTPEQLGQKVKAQYPQYQNMSDGDVGNAVLQKYPQYQQAVTQPSQGGQQAGSNPVMDFLGAVSKPFRSTLQAVQDLGYSGAYGAEKLYGMTGLPGAEQVSQNADKTILNVPHTFLSDQENQQALSNPLKTGIQNGVGVGSFLVSPETLGMSGVPGVLASGAATGGLQSASQDNVNPTSILEGILGGATGAGALHGAGALVGKVASSSGLSNLGDELVNIGNRTNLSQYTGANKDLEKGGAEAIRTLAERYGINNIDKLNEIAPQVTGPDGAVLSDVVRNAVSNSGPVDTGGIEKVTNDLLDQSASINDSQSQKILNMIKKGVGAAAITEGDQNIGSSDPNKVFQLIQDLGSQASKYYQSGGRTGNVADQEMAGVLTGVKRELQDRLFGGFDSVGGQTGKGADAMMPSLTEDQLNTLHAISPQLAQDAMSAKTVGELRSLQRPFVQANDAAETALNRAGSKPINGFESIALLMNPHLWPLLAGSKLINSNQGKSIMGGAAIKAGQALQGTSTPALSPGLQPLLDLLGAKAGAGIATQKK